MIRRALAVVVASIVASASIARAAPVDEPQRVSVYSINPGPYGAFTSHHKGVGGGFEVSVLKMIDANDGKGGWYAFGGIAQIAAMTQRGDDGQSMGNAYLRTLLGVEAAWTGLGVELGWAFLGDNGVEAATHALHVAPFLSLGLFSFAAPLTVPFAHAAGDGHPTEIAFVVALKIPLLVRDGKLGTFLDFFGDAPRPPPPPRAN